MTATFVKSQRELQSASAILEKPRWFVIGCKVGNTPNNKKDVVRMPGA